MVNRGTDGDLFFSVAFMTMAIILLHMFWGVVFFDACEKKRWWCLVVVVTSHLLVSCLVGGVGELRVVLTTAQSSTLVFLPVGMGHDFRILE